MDKAKEEGVDELLRKVEAVVTDTAATCGKVQDLEVKQENAEVKEEVEEEEDLQRLVEERKRLRHEGCKGKSISDLSKQIQRQIKRLQRRKQDKKIRTILDSFSGLKDIAGIRGGGKRKQTNAMRKKDGTEVQGKKQMADVFADFYEDLYATRRRMENMQADRLGQEEGPVEAVTVPR